MNGEKRTFTWKHWSGVIVVFVLGLAIGGLATSVLIREHVFDVMRRGPAPLHAMIADRLTGDLKLTVEQRSRIDSIAAEYEPRFEEFRRASREEVQRLAGEMEGRIREVLTPDQREAFDRSLEEMRRHREHDSHWKHGPGGGPPPPPDNGKGM